MNVLKKKKGFTLVELIVVITIIGILAAVLIPNLAGYLETSKKSAAEQSALAMHKEFLSKVDVLNEEPLLDGNYIVLSDEYYVVIVDGGLSASYKNEVDLLDALDITKEDNAFIRTDVPQNLKYFVLANGQLILEYYYK